MRRLFRTFVLTSALVMVVPASQAAAQYPARETTVLDLLGLQAAGMADEVLIGLFQSDGTVFTLTANDLIYLRQQGLSERVLLAMLNTRNPQPAAAPFPQQVAESPAQDPVVVNVEQRVNQRVTVEREAEAPRVRTQVVQVPVAVPVGSVRSAPRAEPKPVYWGFGGQRRPDSWDPTPTRSTGKPPDPKVDPKGRGGGGRS